MTTTNKDFKVKHGLSVTAGATFGQAIEIGEPTAADHAATKGYVDSFAPIDPVILATTTNINIATDTLVGDFIDGVALQSQTRILIKNQTVESQNGIYVVNSTGPATRALDYNDAADAFAGDLIYVLSGEVNENSIWALSTDNPSLGTTPLNFVRVTSPSLPIEYVAGANIVITDNEIAVEQGVFAGLSTSETLDSSIVNSSLETVGILSSLEVSGQTDVDSLTATGTIEAESLDISGNSIFSGTVEIIDPTASNHAASKNYVDNLVNQESVEITTIDDLSNYFNGYNSRFYPTYKGLPVTLQNPFNLLLTIDGIIQSVGSPDYVWQSVMPRVGFTIDNDGYIAFPEAIPVGSSFDARVLVGSATTTQTKVYPFKAMDIVLGGY